MRRFQVRTPLAALLSFGVAGAAPVASAETPDTAFQFTDERGSVYRLLKEREVTPALTGATVRIDSPSGRFTVMEVLQNCREGTFAYAGMLFGESAEARSDQAMADDVTRYTDADLSSRLRAKDYFPIELMGTEADKAVFKAVCSN